MLVKNKQNGKITACKNYLKAEVVNYTSGGVQL